ncbi:MAG: hypothetical protein ACRDNL_02070, partial [Spirillospora sp.]
MPMPLVLTGPRAALARLLPPGRSRDLTADAVVVVSGVALSLGVDEGRILRPHGGATVVLLLIPALALVFRRRAPMTVAWITAAFAALVWVAEQAAPGTLLRVDADHTVSPPVWW